MAVRRAAVDGFASVRISAASWAGATAKNDNTTTVCSKDYAPPVISHVAQAMLAKFGAAQGLWQCAPRQMLMYGHVWLCPFPSA